MTARTEKERAPKQPGVEWKGEPLLLSTGKRHRLLIPAVTAILEDADGKPVPGQSCVVTGPDGFRVEGVTDSSGSLRVVLPDSVTGPIEVSFTRMDLVSWDVPAPPA